MTFSPKPTPFPLPQAQRKCIHTYYSYKTLKQNLHSTNSLNNLDTKHQPTHNMTGIIKFGGKIATQLKK